MIHRMIRGSPAKRIAEIIAAARSRELSEPFHSARMRKIFQDPLERH
jgi:hypothetical protein